MKARENSTNGVALRNGATLLQRVPQCGVTCPVYIQTKRRRVGVGVTQAPRFCGGPAALSGARQVRRGAPHDLDASQFFGTWPCSARISTRMERDSKRIRAIVTRRRVTVPVPERSITGDHS